MEYNKIEIVKEKKKEEGIIKIPEDRLVKIDAERQVFRDPYIGIPANISGEFDGKAIYLDDEYDWILGRDEDGCLLCIPLEKEDC